MLQKSDSREEYHCGGVLPCVNMPSHAQEIETLLGDLVNVVSWRCITAGSEQKELEAAQTVAWAKAAKRDRAVKQHAKVCKAKELTAPSRRVFTSTVGNFSRQPPQSVKVRQSVKTNHYLYKLDTHGYSTSSESEESDVDHSVKPSSLSANAPSTNFAALLQYLTAKKKYEPISKDDPIHKTEEYKRNPFVRFEPSGGKQQFYPHVLGPSKVADHQIAPYSNKRKIIPSDEDRDIHRSELESANCEDWASVLTTQSYTPTPIAKHTFAFETHTTSHNHLGVIEPRVRACRCEGCQTILPIRLDMNALATEYSQLLVCARCRFLRSSQRRITEYERQRSCKLLIGTPLSPSRSSSTGGLRKTVHVFPKVACLPPLGTYQGGGNTGDIIFDMVGKAPVRERHVSVKSATHTPQSTSRNGERHSLPGNPNATKETSRGLVDNFVKGKSMEKRKKKQNKKIKIKQEAKGRELREELKKEKKDHKTERDLCKQLRLGNKRSCINKIITRASDKDGVVDTDSKMRERQRRQNKFQPLRDEAAMIKKKILTLASHQIETVIWESEQSKKRRPGGGHGTSAAIGSKHRKDTVARRRKGTRVRGIAK